MIVTRQRRKPFPWRRLILPLIAIALVAFVFWWAPSRNVVTSGPLGPLWGTVGTTFNSIATPFHFEQQQLVLTDRNQRIGALQKQISDLQSQLSDKTKQINDLNGQLGQLQAQAASSRGSGTTSPTTASSSAPAVASGASPAAGTGGPVANDLSSGATPDMRRTAQYWANMEPDNVAKVLPKLPVGYVARVLALMSPDSVGAILDALPTAYAAQLTSEDPELKR